MEEFKLTNEKKITLKEWEEFKAFKEEYQENEAKRNLLLQQQNDILAGGIRSANIKVFPAVYVINASDSLDSSYPFLVPFNIISEMTKIVSIKLSFWFLNFRAYSTAATEKEAVTSGASSVSSSAAGGVVSSASGGGPTSGSGGVVTSGVESGTIDRDLPMAYYYATYNHTAGTVDGYLPTSKDTIHIPEKNHTHLGGTHTHSVPSHTHIGGSHTHNIEHTHTVPAHSHNITYGIFEEETSPTIVPSISRDNGLTYSLPIGSYTKDQKNLDITRFIDTAGSKMIKFTSTTRARLSVQITIKLDVKAR